MSYNGFFAAVQVGRIDRVLRRVTRRVATARAL